MKTLSETLEAAQRANSSLPYVEAVFDDYWGYARRARFQRHYTGGEGEQAVAAALAPDGGLLRLRRETQVATLRLQVSASADDSFENGGLNVPGGSGSTVINNDDEYIAYRFQGVQLAQGAAVVRAALYAVMEQPDPKVTLYGHDTDNAAAFTSATNNISGRAATTAQVVCDHSGLVTDGQTYSLVGECAAVVQEIVDRPGWSGGNALALILRATDEGQERGYESLHWDDNPARSAVLEITYATGDPAAEVFVSRVADPDGESGFGVWASLDGEASPLGGVALAVDADICYAFLVDEDLTTVVVRTSADGGASWGARSTVTAAGGLKTHLAAAAAQDGDLVLFYAETDGTVYSVRWDGGSWGSPAAWPHSLHQVDGLAAVWLLDFGVVVCGQEGAPSLDRGVWACRYGDGAQATADEWGELREVVLAGGGGLVWYGEPSVVWTDCWRLFFVEHFTGDEPYDRTQWTTMQISHDFNEEQWREPGAFDYVGAGGVAAAQPQTGLLWLAASDGVWSSALPAYETLDVSARVVAASVRCGHEGAVAELELDNADGAYSGYGTGELGALQRGARLQLTPGYRTALEPEAASPPCAYWVEGIELVTGERPRLRVKARDGWWLLSMWRARRQLSFAAGDRAVSQVLMFLLARAGAEYTSLSTSDALTALRPAFTVHPGESGATAVRRLLALVEDVGFWDGSFLTVKHTATDEAAGYALGPDTQTGPGHDVVEARYPDLGPAVNRARVTGLPGVYAEEIDFAESVRLERIGLSADLNLTDGGEAADRAVAALRQSRLEAVIAEVKLFGVHCGVELWDVVELTDPQAGLEGVDLRVAGYAWEWEPRRGRYEMRLTLGAL